MPNNFLQRPSFSWAAARKALFGYRYLRTYLGAYEMDRDQIERPGEEHFYPESELPIFEKSGEGDLLHREAQKK